MSLFLFIYRPFPLYTSINISQCYTYMQVFLELQPTMNRIAPLSPISWFAQRMNTFVWLFIFLVCTSMHFFYRGSQYQLGWFFARNVSCWKTASFVPCIKQIIHNSLQQIPMAFALNLNDGIHIKVISYIFLLPWYLRLRPPVVSDSVFSATSFQKYQKFPSKIK